MAVDGTGERGGTRVAVERLAPVLLAAVAFAVVAAAVGPWPVGVFQDDGIYVVLAKSLATGHGYRFVQMPGAPFATHYPPLYPAFLALLWKLWPVFPGNVALFKFANAGLLAVGAVGMWRFARTCAGLSTLSAGLATLAFTACAPVVLLAVMVLSEPLFLALLFPVLLVCERAARTGATRDAVLAAVLGVLLSLVRTLGVLVVPATAVVLLWRRQWRATAVLVGVALLAMAPWQWWVAQHARDVPAVFLGKYGSYFGWFTDAVRSEGPAWVWRVARHNLVMLGEQGWATTATDGLPLVVRVLATIALTLLFLGGLVRLLGRAPAAALFVAGYLALVVVWPFAPARFTWGIWPLVGVCYALAVQWLWREWALGAPPQLKNTAASTAPTNHSTALRTNPTPPAPHRVLHTVALAACVALAVGYARYNWLGVSRGWWTEVQQAVADRARPLAEWARANTDTSAVLATDDDVLIHLYTGRRTVPTGAFTAQEHVVPQTPAFAVTQLRRILHAVHVDYVMASTEYGRYATRGLEHSTPPELRLVRVLKTGAIFALPAMAGTER